MCVLVESGTFGSWKDCGLLCQITHSMTSGLEDTEKQETKKEMLKALTKPLTSLIIQVCLVKLFFLINGVYKIFAICCMKTS